jgi:hypothetical protein
MDWEISRRQPPLFAALLSFADLKIITRPRSPKYRSTLGSTKETPYTMPRKERCNPDAKRYGEHYHKRSSLPKRELQCRCQRSYSKCCLRHCPSSTRTCTTRQCPFSFRRTSSEPSLPQHIPLSRRPVFP